MIFKREMRILYENFYCSNYLNKDKGTKVNIKVQRSFVGLDLIKNNNSSLNISI